MKQTHQTDKQTKQNHMKSTTQLNQTKLHETKKINEPQNTHKRMNPLWRIRNIIAQLKPANLIQQITQMRQHKNTNATHKTNETNQIQQP